MSVETRAKVQFLVAKWSIPSDEAHRLLDNARARGDEI